MYTIDDVASIADEQRMFALEEFKSLPDNELLNIWEHTQLVEIEVRQRFGAAVSMAPNYEELILSELHNRLINKEKLEFSFQIKHKKNIKKPRLKRRSPNPLFRK